MRAEFLKIEKATASNSITVTFHYGVAYRGHVVPFEIRSNYKPIAKYEKKLANRIGTEPTACLNCLYFPHDPRYARSPHLEDVKKIALRIIFRDGTESATEWRCRLVDDYYFDYDLGLYTMVKDDFPTFEVDLTFNPR
ncbi:MAG: hypothetical protein PHS79_05360 [Patescibacteria group bacterium]|nr:hypothetical protein [Patescibacteria group bacterium]